VFGTPPFGVLTPEEFTGQERLCPETSKEQPAHQGEGNAIIFWLGVLIGLH
jgi:hypothetical protein